MPTRRSRPHSNAFSSARIRRSGPGSSGKERPTTPISLSSCSGFDASICLRKPGNARSLERRRLALHLLALGAVLMAGAGLELTAYGCLGVVASLRRRGPGDAVVAARWAAGAPWRLTLRSGSQAAARLARAAAFPPGWMSLRWRDSGGGLYGMVVRCSEAPTDCRRLRVRLRLDPGIQGDRG